MNIDVETGGQLLHNLMLFGRVLRGLGLDVNTGRMIDLVHALEHINIGVKDDFYYAARCLMVHDRADLAAFDYAFELFWNQLIDQNLQLELGEIQTKSSGQRPSGPPKQAPLISEQWKLTNENLSAEEPKPILEPTKAYSDQEALRKKDFSELSEEELKQINRLMTSLIWQLGERRTRRYRPGRGSQIDMRRTIRQNLHYGSEPLEWSFRKQIYKPRPVVTIADISGSMERYTRILLQFIYGLSRGLDQAVEAFVFSTRLTRITRSLTNNDIEKAMSDVSLSVPDWSGGTRIGEALKNFNFKWARRVLGRGAVVLLISDGWDRGDPHLLAKEVARLQRSCFRLIWLNPLLGSSDYKPLTRGMQAALPHVDDFLPIHNLASLESLANHLTLLDERRPIRRQQV